MATWVKGRVTNPGRKMATKRKRKTTKRKTTKRHSSTRRRNPAKLTTKRIVSYLTHGAVRVGLTGGGAMVAGTVNDFIEDQILDRFSADGPLRSALQLAAGALIAGASDHFLAPMVGAKNKAYLGYAVDGVLASIGRDAIAGLLGGDVSASYGDEFADEELEGWDTMYPTYDMQGYHMQGYLTPSQAEALESRATMGATRMLGNEHGGSLFGRHGAYGADSMRAGSHMQGQFSSNAQLGVSAPDHFHMQGADPVAH